MENTKRLLLELLKCSKASIKILRNMIRLPQLEDNTYIIRSIYFFDDMKKDISLILKTQNINEESKEYIHNIYECASTLIEMESMITRTIDLSKGNILINKFKTLMKAIHDILIKFAWLLLEIFGPKEAMRIVTPGYQAMSGIWKEYVNFLFQKEELPIEA